MRPTPALKPKNPTLVALAALLLFVTSMVSAMLGLGGGSELEVCVRRQP